MKKLFAVIVPLMILFSVSACCTVFPRSYNDEIYKLMVDCKQDVLALMDKSVTSYTKNQAGIEAVQKKLTALGSLLSEQCDGDASCKQFTVIMAKDKGLFGEFLVRWQEKDKFSRAFIDSWKTNMGAAFDEMIAAETARDK